MNRGTFFIILMTWLSSNVDAEPPAHDCVILLHGLGRTGLSMKRIESDLQRRGYDVVNIGYPSQRLSIRELADDFLPAALARQPPPPGVRVHFVAHSLGGIVLRSHLERHAVTNLGRVVMLAPPNHGSALADALRRIGLLRRFLGPAFLQLGTTDQDVPQQLGPVRFELGVIAGDRTLNPLFSWLIPGPDDGKVSVASTRVEGMKDFVILHTSHTWMMWRRPVLDQIAHFLANGRFAPERAP